MATTRLGALQRTYITLLAAGPVLLAVLTTIAPFGDPTTWMTIAMVALGIEGIFVSRWAWKRPLKGDTPDEIAQSFTQNFFLAFALGEMPMLATFTAAFIVDGYWPFPIGLASFLVTMARIAPTAAHLEEKDRELIGRGSRHLLTEAMSAPVGGRG